MQKEEGATQVAASQEAANTVISQQQLFTSIPRRFTGPMRDIVVLNAGCALMVGGKADDIPSGIELANSLIDEGKALDRLNLV